MRQICGQAIDHFPGPGRLTGGYGATDQSGERRFVAWILGLHLAEEDAGIHCVAGFQFYRSGKRKLDPKLRELGQTRAGFDRGSQFVFSQHCKSSRGVGLTEEQIEAIPSWQVAACFSPIERAALAYTDCLVLDGGRVPEAVFEALRAELSDEEILELTYVTCLYEMHATMCRALRVEYDDVDERVVEVAAPEGAENDVMGLVDR